MNELAINGGRPIRKTYLSYGRQDIDEEDIESVVKVLKGDFLTTGPFVREFEKKVSDYVGAKHAVAVASGTAALHMACFAAGIKEGDEVIVSPITFAASANCVLYCGGTPVFADIDPKTYNIDPKEIEKKITSKTKAIIPVDFTGQSVDIDEIRTIAGKNNLIIIEDSAHALGSEYKGKKVGTKAQMTEFSFHPVKPVTSGEGGMVVTDDDELYKKMILFRSHGITRDKDLVTHNEGPWYYEQIDLGYNYRITDIQCALGASQMNKIDKFISRRRDIAKTYNEAFKDVAEITTPCEAEFSNSGWHLYVIKLNLEKLTCTRKEIFEALQAENIGVNVHYLPGYLHPYYRKLGYEKGLCKNAEELYERMITIPLFPKMTDEDVSDVIDGVKKVINYYKR
ncbi:UDP-4-amino-4,6-dideoxy-N-acetyl-beta-L-altrosamine transaminase [Clostridium autoethanogenum]|uniref:UDP-4-amino-4, 6-dideoxy-N-acetyl-beta-L-altrosamine transaminase n=1 Tax=Clostridium autoethanogenum DSM 10061 TaxID=1341692 RepID=A0ABM5NWR5_9CLOT|nr:UDP-4-amino-4,6-dideoxy-N-acetyl-beta-L-altrosamine transaminase [Clostridium autoethanogenum]AGY76838.1 UDP-4-amino-4,6-dideoxy-N-acetyl-beta-L-altrosamine transaminase [Clostridium autoethanogenum DSM 10061]ALU36988.1 DegT/DnrJ/EryC1/StrS aminotransferase family [Clostridium autoethanogenum DSM 10061]OVY48684.1 UDP-4-amino-4,6-dideoxy-N-acetyl-beta-L-altrosamine transaminase [Clostridium autoethanogenum]